MVPRDRLANAVSLNSASFNAGRLVGPGVAGLTIAAFGTGWTLLLNTLTFVAVLLRPRGHDGPASCDPAPALARGKGAIRDGVRYVRSRPDIQLVMVLVFVLGTFGMNFQITTALMATKEFGKGPQEYGLLGSIMAIGSLTAALLSARRERPRLRVLLVALVGLHRRQRAGRAGAHLLAVRAGARARRPDRAHRPDHGQRHGPAQRRPGHARSRDGPLHGDLHGRHPARARRSSAGSATSGVRAGPSASAPSPSGSPSWWCPSGSARHENVQVTYESQRRPAHADPHGARSRGVRAGARGGPVTPLFRRRVTWRCSPSSWRRPSSPRSSADGADQRTLAPSASGQGQDAEDVMPSALSTGS